MEVYKVRIVFAFSNVFKESRDGSSICRPAQVTLFPTDYLTPDKARMAGALGECMRQAGQEPPPELLALRSRRN